LCEAGGEGEEEGVEKEGGMEGGSPCCEEEEEALKMTGKTKS